MQKKPSELTTQGCGVKYTSFNFVNDKKTLFVQVVVMDALQAEMDLLSSLHLCETCQKKQHQKTLKIEKYCCPNVVLVDPSCSGSGLPLHETMDTNTETDLVKKRCRKLSSFQHKILAHVLQQFRTCPIILYSTCSVKIEENECVVLSALQTTHSEHSLENITSQYWPQDRPEEYIDKYISSAVHQWVNVKKIYSMCFHASYAIDHCRGFFLAKLSRSKQE
jgi:16S rRNA C967 or C1407 C5-methylase (RsmB/RsmF family)